MRARRYAEAEPLLLEAEAATHGNVDALRRAIVSRLIWLYEQWGKSDETAKWRGRCRKALGGIGHVRSGGAERVAAVSGGGVASRRGSHASARDAA